MVLNLFGVRDPFKYWKILCSEKCLSKYTQQSAFILRGFLLSHKSNYKLSLKGPVENNWSKMTCISLWCWLKSQTLRNLGSFWRHVFSKLLAHLFLGQHCHSVSSKKDPISLALLSVTFRLMRDRAWGPVACSLWSSAPYLCVACFLPSVSNGRSWFPRSAVPFECFTASAARPFGKREARTVSPDSCSMEHVFKINSVLPSTLWPSECTHLICRERQNWDVGQRMLCGPGVGTWGRSLVMLGIKEVGTEVAADIWLLQRWWLL